MTLEDGSSVGSFTPGPPGSSLPSYLPYLRPGNSPAPEPAEPPPRRRLPAGVVIGLVAFLLFDVLVVAGILLLTRSDGDPPAKEGTTAVSGGSSEPGGELPPATVAGPEASAPATSAPAATTFEAYPAVLAELEARVGPNPEVLTVTVDSSIVSFILAGVDGSGPVGLTWFKETRSWQPGEVTFESADMYGAFRVRDANPAAPTELMRQTSTADPSRVSITLFAMPPSGLSWYVFADGINELIANPDGTVRQNFSGLNQ